MTEAEAVMVQNALRTYGELRFLVHRGRPLPSALVDLDLDSFLHHGTTAPSRSLNSLRWICRHAGVQWEVNQLKLSEELKKRSQSTKGRALVGEPGMLQHLEEKIESMCRGGDPQVHQFLRIAEGQ